MAQCAETEPELPCLQGCLPAGLTINILTVYTGISSQACTEADLLRIACLQAPARDTPACIASIVHWILSCTMKPGCKCTAQLQQSQQTQLAQAFIQMQGVQQIANSQTGPGTRGVLVVHRHVCTCTMHKCMYMHNACMRSPYETSQAACSSATEAGATAQPSPNGPDRQLCLQCKILVLPALQLARCQTSRWDEGGVLQLAYCTYEAMPKAPKATAWPRAPQPKTSMVLKPVMQAGKWEKNQGCNVCLSWPAGTPRSDQPCACAWGYITALLVAKFVGSTHG